MRNGAPKKRASALIRGRVGEPILKMSPLAAQPAGKIFVIEVPPHSKQGKSNTKAEASRRLKAHLKEMLTPILPALQAHHDRTTGGAICMKVLFLLGSKEPEKDLDNMTKWFWDEFKSLGIDDSSICDLRVMKVRLDTMEQGFIGLTLATVNVKNGDIQSAGFRIGLASKTQDPGNWEERIRIVERVMNEIEQLVEPGFISR